MLAMFHDQGLPVIKYAGFDKRGQRDARPAHHPHVGRSRHGAGARRHRHRPTRAAWPPPSTWRCNSRPHGCLMHIAPQTLRPALPARPRRDRSASWPRSIRAPTSDWSRSARASARSRCRCWRACRSCTRSRSIAMRSVTCARPPARRRACTCTRPTPSSSTSPRCDDGRGLRLVGNLPYNISTPLLFRLIEQREHIRDMHFMLQKEVVDRMAAAPDSEHYGRLTVMLAPWLRVEPLFDIGPGAFRPPPRVISTFVRLAPHAAAAAHRATAPATRTSSRPPSRSGARRCATRSSRC